MATKIYLPKSYNFYDGVRLYLNIIEDSLRSLDNNVEYIYDTVNINKQDTIVTISPYDFFAVWKRKPRHIIHWVQGIAPEETLINDKSFFGKYRRYFQYRLMELLILKSASVLLFVSSEMLKHYRRIYGYKKNNYLIMPCYNMHIDKNSFIDKKYSSPSFVYTGNLAEWQCFPMTLDLFKKIKDTIPNATLTIFTPDQVEAKNLIRKKNIVAEVKYLPAERLALELKKFKYGFLIRENIEVNRVATPIKMNTYLANGIIPIFSDVITSFRKNIGELKYSVIIDDSYDITKIIDLEQQCIDSADVYNDFFKVFENFYSDSHYINTLSTKLREFIL